MSILSKLIDLANTVAIALNNKIDKSNIRYDFYVNPNTGDDSNPGTEERPVKTLEQARVLCLSVPRLGWPMNIHLQSGDYSLQTDDLNLNGIQRLNLYCNNQILYCPIIASERSQVWIQDLITKKYIQAIRCSFIRLNNVTFNNVNTNTFVFRLLHRSSGEFANNITFNCSGVTHGIIVQTLSSLWVDSNCEFTMKGSYSTYQFVINVQSQLQISSDCTYSSTATGPQYYISGYSYFNKGGKTLTGSAGTRTSTGLFG